jgi:hypothetical protein
MDRKLQDLVVDGKEADQALVGTLLAPFVRLDRNDLSIRPQAAWASLGANDRILVYLLARKAMRALDFPLDREEAAPSEISAATGVKRGTVAPGVRRLLSENVLAQKGRAYFVPNHALQNIRQRLQTFIEGGQK